MSPRLGFSQSDAEPNFTPFAKFVDQPPQGLGKIAMAALDALEASSPTTAPARKSHDDVLASNTGWELDPVQWAKRAADTRRLAAQSAKIVEALKRGGVDVQRDADFAMIGAVTGIVEELPVYRAVRFLPTIAARERRPMVNGLKLFMAGHPCRRFFRYAVFTSYEPVPASGELRAAIQTLSRRISKWANRIKRYGMKVLFRGIEFTRKTAEERKMTDRYPADTPLYHVHANVIYWPTRALKSVEWDKFLRETHDFMGAEWKDNGKVEKVEEIVKYCSKPADTLAADDDEILWLYKETQRLKICQPMGDFKAWQSALKKAGEKVVRVNVKGEGRLMRIRKLKRPKAEKKAENATATDGGDQDSSSRESADIALEKPPMIVLGMTLPQWRHTPWAEPMIMVHRYDPLACDQDFDICTFRKRARSWWDDAFAPEPDEALRVARMAMDDAMSDEDVRAAAEAAPYIVHTCRPTVPAADEDINQEEFEDDIKEIVKVFEGARVVNLRPMTPTEDDEIPFEAPRREVLRVRWRAELAESEVRWGKWRASSAAYDCREAA